MDASTILILYCVAIVLVSFFGGALPSLFKMTHRRLQVMISFVAGLMLGVGLFLMLPHAVIASGSLDHTMLWTAIGMIAMFFLLRAFHFHQHEAPDGEGGIHEHDEHCGHDPVGHKLSWLGVATGLAIHTVIDGVALAASVRAEAAHAGAIALAGLGTFLAIALHKPLDAMSITSLMTAGGWKITHRRLVNGIFALMCPAGALLFYFGFRDASGLFLGAALAFSAGVFLCISLGDLLPEIHFHQHDRLRLSAALLAGMVLSFGLTKLEAHAHDHSDDQGHGASESPGDHDHDGHDHD